MVWGRLCIHGMGKDMIYAWYGGDYVCMVWEGDDVYMVWGG